LSVVLGRGNFREAPMFSTLNNSESKNRGTQIKAALWLVGLLAVAALVIAMAS
jgi:hypothetical protein